MFAGQPFALVSRGRAAGPCPYVCNHAGPSARRDGRNCGKLSVRGRGQFQPERGGGVPGATRTRSRNLMLTVVALIVAMAGWLAMMPAANASWTPVVLVSPPGWQGQAPASLAVDGHGNTTLVWAGYGCPHCGATVQVQTRIRSNTGKMGPVRALSPRRLWESWPQAAVDAIGDQAFIWEANTTQMQGRRVSA